MIYRDPKSLVEYERNSRRHSDSQITKIRASLREFGFTNPILLKDDEKTIGAGHARCRAALLEKLARVPTITLHGLSEAQWRAYVIADNQLQITGSSWDETLLRLELSELKSEGFDLSLAGFDSLELTKLFAPQDGFTDPDDVPDELPEAVTQLGDVWRLGPHVLVCGDCTVPSVVETALAGALPMLCLADAPYGTRYLAARRGKEFLADGSNRSKGDVRNDDRADWREAWALFKGDIIYAWHDGSNPSATQLALEAAGFEIRSQIIWPKVQAVVGPPRGHYRYQHESAFYAVRKGGNGHWKGSRKENTLWEADRPKRNDTGHATQKPVALWVKPLENHTDVGEHVFDPFSGSGVLTIACQMTGRIAHSVEIEPAHCDRHLLRFAAFTGTAPVLAETGETFEAVKARRADVGEVV